MKTPKFNPVRTQYNDDSFAIEIFLGSRSQDRLLGFIQCTVMLVGLIILMPDVRQFRFGLDASLVIRSCFAILWTSIGVFVAGRAFLFPPRPALLQFTSDSLHYDSGRAGLRYLGDRFENDLSRLYLTAFQWRRSWIIPHPPTPAASWRVDVSGWNLQIRSDQDTYDFGIALPESQHRAIRSAVLSWFKSDPASAVAHAARAFDQAKPMAGVNP